MSEVFVEVDGSHRVLVIDDHDDTRDLWDHVLSAAGHLVVLAEDGETGLDLLLSQRFDVAVIDIVLPRMDGMDVARQARASLNEETPFLIALTGLPLARVAADLFQVQLMKPVSPQVLLAAVNQALSPANQGLRRGSR